MDKIKNFLRKYGLFTGVGMNTLGIIMVIIFAVSIDAGVWPILAGVFLCVIGTVLIVVGGALWQEDLRQQKKKLQQQAKEMKEKK